MASDIPTEAKDIHNELVFYLGRQIKKEEFHELKNLFSNNNPLAPTEVELIKNIYDLFTNLMRYKTIAVGDYTQFVRKLELTNLDLVGYVNEKENAIKSIVDRGPSPAMQPRPGDQGQQQSPDPATRIATTADTSQAKKIHRDLKPMIETAKARIKKEKEKKFYPTKGFCDAKEKLQKNRVVVIKGNTGDGKTAIAVQLLHWLSQEQQAGQPLQLHEIKKLDLLAPNLKLITFIDDIFGEKDVMCKMDVQEWNKRIEKVKTLFLDEQKETNFLVITVRNEVFNSLEKRSLETIFTKDNLIDLSSETYKVEEEKKTLLELYKPETFSWSEEETNQVLTCAPNIGFPQCCQLFYNSEELQKERVRFFANPFHFLKEALSRLQECSALLYLFLHDGMIKKEKNWSGEDVYRFNHDSIYVAVALLYGKATPIGYIQNCPSISLSYLTTSDTATNMIVISSDHYTEMCERLLREFECEEKRYGTSIGSLDVWNDPVFVERFVGLLNDRKYDKLDVLNKACHFGAEECVLSLLCEGVEPDKVTPFRVLWGGSVKVLRKLLEYDVTPTARDYNDNVLHKACYWEREEMVTLLCDTYPHLVHDTDSVGRTPLHVVAWRGNCSMLQTLERVDDQQHKCESVHGRVVHRNCVCAQYMAQLVDVYGCTVLHSYPALTTAVDEDGRHCLHYLASDTSDVDWFTECESHVKRHLEYTGRKYDITTILDNKGESVLDRAKERASFWAKKRGTENNPMLDHLIQVFDFDNLHGSVTETTVDDVDIYVNVEQLGQTFTIQKL
ncbi:hypothetical protein KP79_PYT06793 [Mizuhopecten yessoensis]|uniref:Novel STAND NTPase 3 domain-containing protein n=1 Tax=Mizuhopecten yessoensis TaxID=6573 RepID=A0A210QFS4_MIZYE|nr:hypothetical protein KP79_PYT06793 [Mizuhopecten yessoensis]